jgi:hypothetical protein
LPRNGLGTHPGAARQISSTDQSPETRLSSLGRIVGFRTDDAFWASGRSSQSRLNNPLFRRKRSIQEVRSVENASTWRRWRQHHPHWYICCPYSYRPRGNGCGQGSCCQDNSSRLSCSRATDHRLEDSDDRGLLHCTGSTRNCADWLAHCSETRALRCRFGSWGFTCKDVANLFEPLNLGIDLLQYFWNWHDYLV